MRMKSKFGTTRLRAGLEVPGKEENSAAGIHKSNAAGLSNRRGRAEVK